MNFDEKISFGFFKHVPVGMMICFTCCFFKNTVRSLKNGSSCLKTGTRVELNWKHAKRFDLETYNSHAAVMFLDLFPRERPSLTSTVSDWRITITKLFQLLNANQFNRTYMTNCGNFSHFQFRYQQISCPLSNISNAYTRKNHRISIQVDIFI